MAEKAEGQQSCKACGTPAGEGELREHCGKVLELSDRRGVVEDEGADARRVFEGRDGQAVQMPAKARVLTGCHSGE